VFFFFLLPRTDGLDTQTTEFFSFPRARHQRRRTRVKRGKRTVNSFFPSPSPLCDGPGEKDQVTCLFFVVVGGTSNFQGKGGEE